jgi:hypothetical protein
VSIVQSACVKNLRSAIDANDAPRQRLPDPQGFISAPKIVLNKHTPIFRRPYNARISHSGPVIIRPQRPSAGALSSRGRSLCRCIEATADEAKAEEPKKTAALKKKAADKDADKGFRLKIRKGRFRAAFFFGSTASDQLQALHAGKALLADDDVVVH